MKTSYALKLGATAESSPVYRGRGSEEATSTRSSQPGENKNALLIQENR